jgi:protein involved in polysaccharide export with SLBB domain
MRIDPSGPALVRGKAVLFALLLTLGAQSLGAQSLSQQSLGSPDNAPASLSPGDMIRIVVWRKPEFSGDFVVASDGTIIHPLYREIAVVGLPLNVVEERVRVFLARYETNPAFVISPLLRVFVGGEVRQPSIYSLPPGTTIAQAVALAGGPTDRGKLDEVLIVRHQEREVVDLTRSDTHAASIQTLSGDQLFVGRRLSFFNDVLAPASSVFAAVATVVSIVIQLRR